MAEASLKLGGSWATKEGSLLGFNDENGNYKPIPFDFTRATTATRVNRNGLIEEVQAGVPRIDFTGDGSLLLEPQRTNSYTYSEDFSQTFWKKGAGLTITINNAVSPDGSQTATKVEKTSQNNLFLRAFFAPAIVGTLSVFVKKGNYRYIGIRNNEITGTCHSVFDFDTETFVTTASNHSLSFVKHENGWYRLIDYVSVDDSSNYQGIAITDSLGNEISTDVPLNSYVYVWGAQYEQNQSYATSYIKTSGSAVTRNADNSIITSASNLIGQTEGTLFIECEYPRTGSGGSARKLISVNDGSSANLVDIFVNAGANTLTARVRANSGQFGVIAISNNPTGVVKIAYAYKANDYVLYINGTQYGSVTTGGAFTFSSALDVIQIGDGEAANDELGGKCPQAMLYKTRLTNTELAELTTI